MSEQTYTIQGMKCDGCVRTVEERLGAVPGVREVKVSLADKTVKVTGDVTREKLAAALQGTRFTLA